MLHNKYSYNFAIEDLKLNFLYFILYINVHVDGRQYNPRQS
jgi:hypothetical protein